MSEIKIIVESPGLPEAINNLAKAIRDWTEAVAPAPKACDACKCVEAVEVADRPTTQTDSPSAPANDTAAAAAPNGPAQTSSPSDKVEQKSYTLDDLSRAGADLIDAGKMPQLLDLLKSYGVQALTQLDPGTYPAVADALKALGAKL